MKTKNQQGSPYTQFDFSPAKYYNKIILHKTTQIIPTKDILLFFLIFPNILPIKEI